MVYSYTCESYWVTHGARTSTRRWRPDHFPGATTAAWPRHTRSARPRPDRRLTWPKMKAASCRIGRRDRFDRTPPARSSRAPARRRRAKTSDDEPQVRAGLQPRHDLQRRPGRPRRHRDAGRRPRRRPRAARRAGPGPGRGTSRTGSCAHTACTTPDAPPRPLRRVGSRSASPRTRPCAGTCRRPSPDGQRIDTPVTPEALAGFEPVTGVRAGPAPRRVERTRGSPRSEAERAAGPAVDRSHLTRLVPA